MRKIVLQNLFFLHILTFYNRENINKDKHQIKNKSGIKNFVVTTEYVNQGSR